MRTFPIYAIVVCLSAFTLQAQPTNDYCDEAFFVDLEDNWCSEAGDFSNIDANVSTGLLSSCLSPGGSTVWFSFIPTATSVSILVFSNSGFLVAPQIGLYEGDCGNLTELACEAPSFTAITELIFQGLTLGVPHYIVVQGTFTEEFDFQICLSAFNAPASLSSDCPQASVLCNKESFIVPKVFGGGIDPTEANDAPCLAGLGGNVESSSTWFVWTAANDGALTFSLDPLNPSDDLDFVVYEFPDGPGDCSNKIPLRCMASSCEGPTGLDLASTDFEEPPNCFLPTQDNFLAALDMVEGTTYGMMINNFSTTGIGFGVTFGGDGEFAGPEGEMLISPSTTICTSESISFADGTNFPNGAIVAWEWNFGPDASITTANTQGPHSVSYEAPGTKFISLQLTTDEGCIITQIEEIEVICCVGAFEVDADITAVSCIGSADGSISLSVNSPTGPPYSFNWSNGESTAMIENLSAGPYAVTITDETACDTILQLEVPTPSPLVVDTTLAMPSCNGGTDGSITVDIESGGTPPFIFSWQGGPFTTDNVLAGLGVGDYSLVIQDNNGCETPVAISLNELELTLEPDVQAIIPPSCPGYDDAQLNVVIANGLPPFQYDFNDGNGYVNENALTQLSAGTYEVDVIDANLCMGNFTFFIEDPIPIGVSFEETPIQCSGDANGSLTITASGGSGSYSYAWNTGDTSPTISGLAEGTYIVSITDGAGCMLESSYLLVAPSTLELSIDTFQHITCFDGSNGFVQLLATGGRTPYTYFLDNGDAQAAPLFDNLAAGAFSFLVQDSSGCTSATMTSLTAPPQIWVSINELPTISLGYSGQIRTTVSQPGLIYNWSPPTYLSCADCPDPEINPIQSAVYTLTVEDEQGCQASDSIFVSVDLSRPVYLPNAFSPNGDGRNDLFQVYTGPAVRKVLSLSIFNRWGGLVYEAENLSATNDVLSWDGLIQNSPAPSGVYTYMIKIEFIDDIRQSFSGSINLIR
jgi:gliding motility-associated-like protein